MSGNNPIINGPKFQKTIGNILNRLKSAEAQPYLVTKVSTPSVKDKALGQKGKVQEKLHPILPMPAIFQAGYKEMMQDQGIVVAGDLKIIVSGTFSIVNDSEGNPVSYRWEEGDIVSYKDLLWRVYMVKTASVDMTIITYTLMVRREPGEGYVPTHP